MIRTKRDLAIIDRNNIRYCMKRLRNNEALYLHGIRISYIPDKKEEKFRIEYSYQGTSKIVERKAAWVRTFLKNAYLSENVYSTNYDMLLYL